MSFKLLSSPLQGYTDFRFRNSFNKCFGGIDTFYAPYIRLNGLLEIKPSNARDILPDNNIGLNLIPQVLTNNADEFLFVAKYVQELGYNELNWNLGCPYPMVTKRGLGSGLLDNPAKIHGILNKILSESDIIVSVKMRLGYTSSEEILRILPILNAFPLKNIAIHPRLGKQLYKGEVDLDAFQRCIDNSSHIIYYNGDITSVAGFNALAERFPAIDNWMIGRGLIANPFLPGMIKNNTPEYPDNRIELFCKFHDMLFREYSHALSGPSHIILKMFNFWEYFIRSFSNSAKRLKKIKKAKSIRAYEDAVMEILTYERGNKIP
jgi:tRNA-dihydrouridine synthase